jgi:hypothetical protein
MPASGAKMRAGDGAFGRQLLDLGLTEMPADTATGGAHQLLIAKPVAGLLTSLILNKGRIKPGSGRAF